MLNLFWNWSNASEVGRPVYVISSWKGHRGRMYKQFRGKIQLQNWPILPQLDDKLIRFLKCWELNIFTFAEAALSRTYNIIKSLPTRWQGMKFPANYMKGAKRFMLHCSVYRENPPSESYITFPGDFYYSESVIGDATCYFFPGKIICNGAYINIPNCYFLFIFYFLLLF